jgi:lipid A 4'-phosphatase
MMERSRAGLAVVAVLWALAIVVALFAPDLDLHLMKLIHAATGGRFLGNGGLWAPLYFGLPYLIYAIAALALILLVAGITGWSPARRVRRSAILVLGTLLAYLVIVESVLKNNWGRARPRDIAEFGGNASYTPPLMPADQCAANCAFVSGHAAAAFTLVAVALVVPTRWRVPAFSAALVVGLLTGAMRIMQGAHFPFDIVFAGLIVVTAALLLDLALPYRVGQDS